MTQQTNSANDGQEAGTLHAAAAPSDSSSAAAPSTTVAAAAGAASASATVAASSSSHSSEPEAAEKQKEDDSDDDDDDDDDKIDVAELKRKKVPLELGECRRVGGRNALWVRDAVVCPDARRELTLSDSIL